MKNHSLLFQKLEAGIRWLSSVHIPHLAANTGYFIILSVFPALLLILSGLRFTGLSVDTLLDILGMVLPQALMGTARELVYSVYENASGAVAGLSALTALWSSSRGVYGLLVGLNTIYGVSEDRGYFYTRAISILYTFAFEVVILLTLVLHVFGGTLASFFQGIPNPAIQKLMNILDLRFGVLLVLQSLLFTLMFMIFPNRRNGFWESLPGGLFACIGWMLFSNLYSLYVTHFPSYANIYGSVYAIAISMLWLYCCLEIIFFGGALNRLLMNMTKN
ncbi:MAG: YihY/virulence factor BrkB family protein [Clostridiales bacterium]|nr:YihY/virulence factor BrkB family protein [Clostridiales bacterium]